VYWKRIDLPKQAIQTEKIDEKQNRNSHEIWSRTYPKVGAHTDNISPINPTEEILFAISPLFLIQEKTRDCKIPIAIPWTQRPIKRPSIDGKKRIVKAGTRRRKEARP
jgi:hypothetical protein